MFQTILLQATEGIDTTALDYRIGYQIGSWLPFAIIAALAIGLMVRQYRQGGGGEFE